MRQEHWPEVRQIFQEGIETGISTFETEPPEWEEFDKGHLRCCRFVSKDEGQVTGWAALTPVSNRKAYSGVAEVSIYVSEKAKSKGNGSALMEQLISCSEEHGIWTLQSIVFPENKVSIELHKKFGFRIVGYREKISKNRFGNWQDTILLERRSRI